MVFESENNMSYSDYLNSSHWKETRQKRLKENPHKNSWVGTCEICNLNEKLHIHHSKYTIGIRAAIFGSIYSKVERKPGSILGRELPEELFVFCSSCHSLWHKYFGLSYPKKKVIQKIRHLMAKGAIKNKAFWVATQPDLYNNLIWRREVNINGR